MNIALPHIGADLGAGSEALTWVVNGYTLTLAALVLLGGALGDRFGRRRVYVIGILGFAIASAACGLAPDVGTLIAARSVQGVAAALLTPGSLAILQASFATDDRSRAIGAWSGLTGVAGAIGPFFGGWIIQVADWRWAFLVNLPIAAVVILITLRHVPESRPPRNGDRLDWTGAGLLALCLAALTFALTASASAPFLSSRVGGAVFLSLVVGRRLRVLGAPLTGTPRAGEAVRLAGLRRRQPGDVPGVRRPRRRVLLPGHRPAGGRRHLARSRPGSHCCR